MSIQHTRDRSARPKLSWFALGALSAMCLAGPVSGAGSALFWPHIGGGHTEAGAAMRIIRGQFWRTYNDPDLPGHAHEDEPTGKCEDDFELHSIDELSGQFGMSNLLFSIRSEAARRQQEASERPVMEALMALPYPALGALEGCLGRSLFSPLCELYLDRLAADARRRNAPAISRQKALSKVDMERVWCLALHGVAPPARSTPSSATFPPR